MQSSVPVPRYILGFVRNVLFVAKLTVSSVNFLVPAYNTYLSLGYHLVLVLRYLYNRQEAMENFVFPDCKAC